MTRPSSTDLIPAEWQEACPARALTTTRIGGVSEGPWRSFNLGACCGDSDESVQKNRICLEAAVTGVESIAWLQQVHGDRVVRASPQELPLADAQWTDEPGLALAVLTADCLPVVLTDSAGTRVAVAHAGWRGLAVGVLENTVAALSRPASDLQAWLGPAIGASVYEVDAPVRAAFVEPDPGAERHFHAVRPGHWLMDLYGLARDRLGALGLDRISGGELCTFSEPERFYSYRRDGVTGRMATLAWIPG